MIYLLNLVLLSFYITHAAPLQEETDQQQILQTVFDIEEFQSYLATSPRFVGTFTKQEIMMMSFEELEDANIPLHVREKQVKIFSKSSIEESQNNFFIRVDEYQQKKNSASLLISYQNARMYYEKEQKILLDAKLQKNGETWEIASYKLYQVSVNIAD